MKQFESLEESMLESLDDTNEKEISEIAEIIDKSDIGDEDKARIYAHIRREEFAGPIPHPAILEKYEQISPGLANGIFQMAVDEQKHRHLMQKTLIQNQVSINEGQLKVIETSLLLKSRLQLFGFLLTILLIIGGFVCIILNKNIGSVSSFILAIGSFCWTMFYGKKTENEEEAPSDETEQE